MGRAAMASEAMATRCSPSPESHSDSRRRSCCISARMASFSWTVRVRQGAQGKASGGSTCSSSEYSSPHESRTSWSSKSPSSCAQATCVMWGGSSRFLRTGCQGRGVRSANPTRAALGAGRKLTWIVCPPSSGKKAIVEDTALDNSRRNGSCSATESVVEPVPVGASPIQIEAMANGWPRLACPEGKRTRRSALAKWPRDG
jgi:hypothetical protein